MSNDTRITKIETAAAELPTALAAALADPENKVKWEAVEKIGATIHRQTGTSHPTALNRDNRFDAIHASPPCQRWSTKTSNPDAHPDLITPLRPLLEQTGLPWIIENVPGAPLNHPVELCGSTFGLGVRRHRDFECSFPAEAMGIDWMTDPELADAIPPAYTEFIGHQLRPHLSGSTDKQATTTEEKT